MAVPEKKMQYGETLFPWGILIFFAEADQPFSSIGKLGSQGVKDYPWDNAIW